MKILLDENFPLQLYHRLRQAGHDAEHVIALGKRGMPDSELRQRLAGEELVFLTNDTEFEDLAAECRAQAIISRLPQRLPISQRVTIWFRALEGFLERKPTEKLFDLLPDGRNSRLGDSRRQRGLSEEGRRRLKGNHKVVKLQLRPSPPAR